MYTSKEFKLTCPNMYLPYLFEKSSISVPTSCLCPAFVLLSVISNMKISRLRTRRRKEKYILLQRKIN